MMRSQRPLLARSNMATATATPPPVDPINIPSIRLISATPSASGLSSEASTSFNRSLEQSWTEMASQQSILAPKFDPNDQPRKKLVPKKSKLSILNIGRDKEKDRAKDFSDVVRRVGAPAEASARGGFEIYVDPTVDPDLGDILIVKKKKSRRALDGMSWGVLGEATNVPPARVEPVKKENPAMLKVKADEEKKWWSIGRGRKDSKEKEKEKTKGKENKTSASTKSSEHTLKVADRSKSPEPPLKTTQEPRGRFNSLDSGLLLDNPTAQQEAGVRSTVRAQSPTIQLSEPEPERARSSTPSAGMFFRSATPTIGGLLAPPGLKQTEDKSGSIALRAIRSMRSLATMGSWAQPKGSSTPTAQEMAEDMKKAESEGEKHKEPKKKKKDGTVKEKKKKDGTVKEKKKTKEESEKKSRKDKDSSGTLRKSVKSEKAQTVRMSTSSFEIGHLSASTEEPKATVSKKHSILGLGLPSAMRLPRMRGGSTASSLNLNAVSSPALAPPTIPPCVTSTSEPNRLSVENLNSGRRASVSSSNGSSLRPVSVASSNSRLSTGSSVVSATSGTSVKWDEHGLETVREQRRKEREERRMSEDSASSDKADRRTSRESRRSSEGRRRAPLSSLFPEVHHHQIGTALLNDVAEESHEVSKDMTAACPSDSDAASTISTNTTTSSMRARRRSYGAYPILTIEEATSDGHGDPKEEEMEEEKGSDHDSASTPVKRRVRPMSEQLLGRARPKAIHEEDEGVLSILSAATNDLALLINALDLQATPSTPDMTPLKHSNARVASPRDQDPESPLKRTLRRQVSSLASLRPYAQSRGYSAGKTPSSTVAAAAPDVQPSENKKQTHANLVGQQIAPWPVLIAAVSPSKGDTPALTDPARAISPLKPFKLGHKRTMTPAPEPEPEPTFQPLKPARTKAVAAVRDPKPTNHKLTVDVQSKGEGLEPGLFSSRTFGSISSRGSMTLDDLGSTGGTGSLTPVFRRIQHLEDAKRTSLCGSDDDHRGDRDTLGACSQRLGGSVGESFTAPIAREARKALGRSGTLGGSDLSVYGESHLDGSSSDPDSDVPDELKLILATRTHSDRGSIADSLSLREEEEQSVPTATLAPVLSASANDLPQTPEPPVFRLTLTDDDQTSFGIDGESAHSSEEDTKKSFDFTGEIKKLNESGASDRASFVEQLEMAFKTPAKIDLCYEFGTHLRVQVPPLPAPPAALAINASSDTSSLGFEYPSQSQLLDLDEPSGIQNSEAVSTSQDTPDFDSSASQLVDVREPTLLHAVIPDETDAAANRKERSNESIELARSTRSTGSAHSEGELDRSFKFGGRPDNSSSDHALTLSDIIPPPRFARAISEASMLYDIEDDSVLRSIYAKLMGKDNMSDQSNSVAFQLDGVQASRPSSGISFAGFDTFDEVRRGFEFSGDRSFYPPPLHVNRRGGAHRREESAFSIASVSTYGRVLNNGVSDPFEYGLPSLRERPSSEDVSSISMSMSVEDTFAFLHDQPRRRVDSDASSFYFRPLAPAARGHGRRESNISVTSQAPPISLYNRSFGYHRRNDSSASSSSIAMSYAKHGANSGIAAWARHRRELSTDSVLSDFSAMHLGRPGIGDKMFDRAVDLGPLTSISASPPNTEVSDSGYDHHPSYDSIMDEQRSSVEDSLFERTGHRSSVSSDYVFGDDASQPYGGLLLPNQYRPLSVLSLNTSHGPIHEDDTMISMLGGGHVRRLSLVSLMDASPCVRVEKRKHSAIQEAKAFRNVERDESPNKARVVEKPSIASASSFQFGDERMIKAQQGLLERQSLEDSCFVADGEDVSGFCMPVFTHPLAARSRSSTCTSSSGADTPPLSSSDGSSVSEGSQSSIDLRQLNIALANATHPPSNMGIPRARVRARGKGHRRRYSKSHVSRSSVYETIEEEVGPSPSKSLASKRDNPTPCRPIFIVDSDTASIHSKGEESTWNDEQGIVALRKFYALRDEAETTVSESKRTWIDTPFSLFALQSFQPPHHPAGMRALLEHSVQSYGPLPSALRPHRVRSRTSSRPSPYPANRKPKSSVTTNTSKDHIQVGNTSKSSVVPVLRELPVRSNMSVVPMLDTLKPFSPLVIDTIKTEKLIKDDKNSSNNRPRVASTARRTALGWSKRSTGKSADRKENVAVGKENLVATGTTTTPGNTLRLSRPRPKGRTPGGRTPASQNRPIRI